MVPSGKVFVRAVMAELEVDTPRTLCRALNNEVEESGISRWWRGEGAPSYRGMMVMLERTGWLTAAALERLVAAQRDEDEAARRRAKLLLEDALGAIQEDPQPEKDSPAKPRHKTG